ncbi:MAG TPA: hypothetical protein DCR55_00600 [Lentisphaeria bacterium]|nr:hypothetical protein [Lentisphaeria bacterium]
MSDAIEVMEASAAEPQSAFQSVYIIPLEGCFAAHAEDQLRVRYDAEKRCAVLIRPQGRDRRWDLISNRVLMLKLEHEGAEALTLCLEFANTKHTVELPPTGGTELSLPIELPRRKSLPMRLELSWQMIRPGELRITDLACAKPPQAVADAVLDAYGLRIDNEASESINDEAIAEFANAPLPEPPTGRGPFGSWEEGPVFDPPGTFALDRDQDGRPWLVTPGGSGMRSFGCHGVSVEAAALPRSADLNIIDGLPDRESALVQAWRGFAKSEPHLPEMYPAHLYGDSRGKFVNLHIANLARVWGSAWHDPWCTQTESRLRSLGFNTLGTRSDLELAERCDMPYLLEADRVCARNFKELLARPKHPTFPLPTIPDAFNNGLRKRVKGWFRPLRALRADPHLLGYIVNAGVPWHLFQTPFAMPGGWQSRRTFMAKLKKKYETIEALNEAWGSDHASWKKISTLQQAAPPEISEAGKADCNEFLAEFADRYFSIVTRELRFADSHHLIWGCRLPSLDLAPGVLDAIAAHCDIVSATTAADIAKPVAVMPDDSTPITAEFATACLRNPQVVGFFWPSFVAEPALAEEQTSQALTEITGRLPAETVERMRTISTALYQVSAEE